MDKFLIVLCVLVAAAMVLLVMPDGLMALAVVATLSGIALFVFRKYAEDKKFITNVFLGALLVRIIFGIFVHVYDLRGFFGGDADTYDYRAGKLVDLWYGLATMDDPDVRIASAMSGAGWGMNYLVATLYSLFGRNIFVAQSFCGVFGAATAPMGYFCAKKIFGNIRVAKFSAIAIALFPSFVIWSAQLLKDGLMIFMLVLAITMVLELQDRFNYFALAMLVGAIFSIMSFRFYIFYMLIVAVAGSFVIGTSNQLQSMLRRTITMILVGLGLTYFGVVRTGTTDLQAYGNLEAVQRSRSDLTRSAKTGFGEDVDVSTTQGAISAVPKGLMYLMLAPFPWEAANLRQSITVPEVLIWYLLLPLVIPGVWYTLKKRFRAAFPILIFTIMLTLAYSIFQGNVGTAYRQRTQIQVFMFMFIGVGYVLVRENNENKALERKLKIERLESTLRHKLQ